jgi:hypothetical protein
MERGRETKKLHLGTPRNHKVFVPIWGLTYIPKSTGISLEEVLARPTRFNMSIYHIPTDYVFSGNKQRPNICVWRLSHKMG